VSTCGGVDDDRVSVIWPERNVSDEFGQCVRQLASSDKAPPALGTLDPTSCIEDLSLAVPLPVAALLTLVEEMMRSRGP
jgi:hypothetical protein